MKQLFFTLLVALAVLMPKSMAAYDFEKNGIYYNILNSTEVEVTSYYELNEASPEDFSGGYGGIFVIPEAVDYNGVNYTVTAIGDYAFCGCIYLESVTIPNTVTRIGDFAFAYDPYTNVICFADPQEMIIGESAFYAEDYYSRTLFVPSWLSYYYWDDMRWTEFFYNIAYTDFRIDDIEYNMISSWAVEARYYNNKDVEEAVIPETIELEGRTFYVTSIGDDCFSNCSNMRSVTLPTGITSIGERAFSYCSVLTEISIPEYVSNIGDEAFMGCRGLTSVTVPSGVTVVNDGLFRYCEGLTNVTLGYSVTSIGADAFQNCKGLTSLRIPNRVKRIGVGAFSGCENLASMSIPNSVTSIGEYAFLRCYHLASITIGSGVTSIGDYAFDACSDLTSLYIPKSVTSIGFRAFSSTASVTSITVENGNPVYDSRNNCNAIIETSSNTLITGCGVTVIPNTVTAIGEAAFFNAPYHYVRIPGSVTTIGKDAFAGCWIRSVTCLATTPPTADEYLFYNGSTSTLSATVPNASIPLYQNAVGWNFFRTFYGLGDVDGNGELNVSDVIGLINDLISSEQGLDNPAADFNGDGEVNITDIVDLINYLMKN